MTYSDIIVIAVIVVILAIAIGYIIRAKKSGKKCIGCPDGGCCSGKNGKNNSCCCCSGEDKNAK